MSKTMRVFSIMMVLMIALSTVVCATTVGGITINPTTTGNGVDTVTNAGNKILGIIQVAGIVIAVGVIMVVGIKYMMGSAEEKAEYKKVMIPLIIGAILLGCAALFADKLLNVGSTLFQ